jgi:hypothetical protein
VFLALDLKIVSYNQEPGKMVGLQPIFRKAYWSLVGFGAIYGVFLLSVTFKSVQRQYVSFGRNGWDAYILISSIVERCICTKRSQNGGTA